MRIRRMRLAVIGAALAGVTAISGCSSDAMEDAGLPSADSMSAISEYIGKYTKCGPVELNSQEGTKSAAAKDPAWAIEERGVCEDSAGGSVTLLRISDMKRFQEAVKAEGGRGLLVGQDFAVEPTQEETIAQLIRGDLLYLNCDPDYEVPSGYEQQKALVAGCTLTNYVSA